MSKDRDYKNKLKIKFKYYDDRRDTIRDFIIRNDRCTKTQVIDYMSGNGKDRNGNKIEKSQVHAALQTTINILNDMIRNNEVISTPDSKNSQIHHLSINDNYSKIHKHLKKMRSLINTMNEPVHRVNVLGTGKTLIEDAEYKAYMQHLINPYLDTTYTMMRIFFEQIKNLNISPYDSYKLHEEIMEMSQMLIKQLYEIDNSESILNGYKNLLIKQYDKLKSDRGMKRDVINEDNVKKIIDNIIEFEEKFLHK